MTHTHDNPPAPDPIVLITNGYRITLPSRRAGDELTNRPAWPGLVAARRASLRSLFTRRPQEWARRIDQARAERDALELELTPAELIAEHTGRREYLDG